MTRHSGESRNPIEGAARSTSAEWTPAFAGVTEKAERPVPFPWVQAMRIGLGRLGLSSAAFWAMTPRELSAAIEGAFGEGARPLDRPALAALIERFPDTGA